MDAFKKKLLISILATIVSGCGGESSSSAVNETGLLDNGDGVLLVGGGTSTGTSTLNSDNYVAAANLVYTKTFLDASTVNLYTTLFLGTIKFANTSEVKTSPCGKSGTSTKNNVVDTKVEYELAVGDSNTVTYNNCENLSGVTTTGERSRRIDTLEGTGRGSTFASISYQEDFYETGKPDNQNDGQYRSSFDVKSGHNDDTEIEYFAINPSYLYASKTPDIGIMQEGFTLDLSSELANFSSSTYYETPIFNHPIFAFEMIIAQANIGDQTAEKTSLQWIVDADSKQDDKFGYRTETISPLVLQDMKVFDDDGSSMTVSVAMSGKFFIQFLTGETILVEAFSPTGAVPGTAVSDEENVTVSFDKNSDGNYEAVRHMSWTNFGFGGILSTY
ncbi:MAG: hypothetical protein H7A01_01585 [Hahellaceae bacterium]|nr:hypothetical protein [Hahellaceae bacterium]MCP5212663.1 hypothetical protein [Hahellaceae bacterium]